MSRTTGLAAINDKFDYDYHIMTRDLAEAMHSENTSVLEHEFVLRFGAAGLAKYHEFCSAVSRYRTQHGVDICHYVLYAQMIVAVYRPTSDLFCAIWGDSWTGLRLDDTESLATATQGWLPPSMAMGYHFVNEGSSAEPWLTCCRFCNAFGSETTAQLHIRNTTVPCGCCVCRRRPAVRAGTVRKAECLVQQASVGAPRVRHE